MENEDPFKLVHRLRTGTSQRIIIDEHRLHTGSGRVKELCLRGEHQEITI